MQEDGKIKKACVIHHFVFYKRNVQVKRLQSGGLTFK